MKDDSSKVILFTDSSKYKPKSRQTLACKVQLIRPPLLVGKGSLSFSAGTPSIGLAYIAGALVEIGVQVSVLDAVANAPDQFTPLHDTDLLINGYKIDQILRELDDDADYFGISCMFSCDWLYTCQVINAIKTKYPNKIVIAGGEHITADANYSLNSAPIDFCVMGEGEETIVELLTVLESKNEPFSSCSGIAYLENGEFIQTPRRARIRDLSEIPKPDWTSYPLEVFLSRGMGFNKASGRPMPMLASRGCPYQCTFCSNPKMWTTRWVARNPIDVVNEIEEYIKKYEIDHVEFYDLTAIVKKQWILDFSREVTHRGMIFNWSLPSGTRSEALDQEVLIALKQAGCDRLVYAPESGSPSTLKRIKKKVNLERMLTSISCAENLGIKTKANIVFGFPGQTVKESFETIGFVIRCAFVGMHDISVFNFIPYPGSEIFDDLIALGYIDRQNKDYAYLLTGNVVGNLRKMKSWSNSLSTAQIKMFILSSVLLFYFFSYVRRPSRFFSLWRNVLHGNPTTTMELIVYGQIRKLKRTKSNIKI